MKTCELCGGKNEDNASICRHCGSHFTTAFNGEREVVDAEVVEPGEKRAHEHHQDRHCPYCGSTDINYTTVINHQEYDVGSGCCGWILFGPIGLLMGFLCGNRESKVVRHVCRRCGRQF